MSESPKCVVNSGLSNNAYENISKWPLLRASVLRFFVVFQRQFKPMKTLVLLRSLARVFRGLPALKVMAKVRFLRRVRPNEVEVLVVLRVVFLDASQIIKGTQSFPFTTSQSH